MKVNAGSLRPEIAIIQAKGSILLPSLFVMSCAPYGEIASKGGSDFGGNCGGLAETRLAHAVGLGKVHDDLEVVLHMKCQPQLVTQCKLVEQYLFSLW